MSWGRDGHGGGLGISWLEEGPIVIRVLVAKPGLDGHDRGAKVIARALRDAGMEVVYTGLHQTPEQIVDAALQEDVDVLALSILSGAHPTLVPRIMDLVRENKMDNMLVLLGGIIPDDDVDSMIAAGISRVFGPGTDTQDIVDYIRERVADDD
jgi:methylmalonyl-CoA mutase C-terminal domain/subunit